MLRKIIVFVVVTVAVTLLCLLLGAILVTLRVAVAVTVGQFLQDWATVIGILAGIWYAVAGPALPNL